MSSAASEYDNAMKIRNDFMKANSIHHVDDPAVRELQVKVLKAYAKLLPEALPEIEWRVDV